MDMFNVVMDELGLGDVLLCRLLGEFLVVDRKRQGVEPCSKILRNRAWTLLH